MIPPGYEIEETQLRLEPSGDFRTRFRRRAERRCARGNAARLAPSYRYEVIREDGRWVVASFQNVLRKKR